MALTRIHVAGFDSQDPNECDEFQGHGSASAIISNAVVHTDTHSQRMDGLARPRGKAFSSPINQVRANYFLNYVTLQVTQPSSRAFLYYMPGVSFDCRVALGQADLLEIHVNGVQVATASLSGAGLGTPNVWKSIGLTAFSDPANGFITLYVDGVQVITYSGNTGTGFNGVYVGGNTGTGTGWGIFYVDDFYIDEATGEPDQAPNSPIFPYRIVDGDGDFTNWTPVGAATNWQAVDDPAAPDGDTTFNFVTAAAIKDAFTITDTIPGVTIPPGYVPVAIIPYQTTRRSDAGILSTVKLGIRDGAGNELLSGDLLPGVSYRPLFARFTTTPTAGPITEVDINGMQLVVESSGAFA